MDWTLDIGCAGGFMRSGDNLVKLYRALLMKTTELPAEFKQMMIYRMRVERDLDDFKEAH